MFKILIGVIIVAVVVIGGFMVLDPDISITRNNEITLRDDETEGKVSYTIEGEVSKPGTYTLNEGITMMDLISAAGGLTTNADDCCYYDNAELKSGSSYYISQKYDVYDVCSKTQIEKVNINTDDAKTLTNVNGISASIANAIVSYRTETSVFTTLEQIMEVYGIGNATYHKVRNYIILHE